MSQTHEIEVGGTKIEFRLRRSQRKTLAITVRPDLSVVVTAPRGADLEAVKGKVRKRAVWIRRQQRFFEQYLPPVPPRRYVSGETHRYLGRQYRLKVVEAVGESVKLKGRFIHVETRRKADTELVRRLVEGWYVAHARAAFARSLRACLPGLQGHVKGTPRLYLRRMAAWTSATASTFPRICRTWSIPRNSSGSNLGK